jgi:hypothetical protein
MLPQNKLECLALKSFFKAEQNSQANLKKNSGKNTLAYYHGTDDEEKNDFFDGETEDFWTKIVIPFRPICFRFLSFFIYFFENL